MTEGTSIWRRPNANSCCVNAAARSAAELVRLNVELGDLGTDLTNRATHAAETAAKVVAVLDA